MTNTEKHPAVQAVETAVCNALSEFLRTKDVPHEQRLRAMQFFDFCVKDDTRAAVARARQDGLTWEAVGQPLGISKQAAQQRFGAKDADRRG